MATTSARIGNALLLRRSMAGKIALRNQAFEAETTPVLSKNKHLRSIRYCFLKVACFRR
ncbi:hypothetical protein [Tropicimonas sp. S265A]|uniref:hypothetical protein n=1 Tax=Tropicimonas sp. S265A TaxID=3415134 RepID=UPI003C79AB82